jgi:hypothetical protein
MSHMDETASSGKPLTAIWGVPDAQWQKIIKPNPQMLTDGPRLNRQGVAARLVRRKAGGVH